MFMSQALTGYSDHLNSSTLFFTENVIIESAFICPQINLRKICTLTLLQRFLILLNITLYRSLRSDFNIYYENILIW